MFCKLIYLQVIAASIEHQIQVLNLKAAHSLTMISPKQLLNIVVIWIYLLKHEIGIHLLGRCENYESVIRLQCLEKLLYARSNLQFLVIREVLGLFVVNQRFIQIEHQGIHFGLTLILDLRSIHAPNDMFLLISL